MPVNLNSPYASTPTWRKNLNTWQTGQTPFGSMQAPQAPMSPIVKAPNAPGGFDSSGRADAMPGFYAPPKMPDNAGDRKGVSQKVSYDLMTHLLPLLQGQVQFGNMLEPQRQALIQQLLSLGDPRMLQQLAATNRAGLIGQATSSGQNMAGQLRGLGASNSTQMGAITKAQDDATRQANQYQASLTSLPNMMQFGQQGVGLINQNQQPNLGPFQDLIQNIYNKPKSAGGGGGGLLGTIGQIAGLGTGLGFDWGKVFA